jgi:hypothetical protein
MGHPSRRPKRLARKEARQQMIPRRTLYDYLDLTPYNVVGKLKFKEEFSIKYK